jgi:hypothetical protein
MFNTRFPEMAKAFGFMDMGTKIYERHVFWQPGVFLALT